MSLKIHASDADRQRAYRDRQRAGRQLAPAPRRVTGHASSRPARLQWLAAEVMKLSAEYQAWLDRLPDNLANSSTAGQLQEVIEQLDEVHAILEAVSPPRVGA